MRLWLKLWTEIQLRQGHFSPQSMCMDFSPASLNSIRLSVVPNRSIKQLMSRMHGRRRELTEN